MLTVCLHAWPKTKVSKSTVLHIFVKKLDWLNPPILLNAPWQTFNSLNLTPYCEKTLKQKIRQTRFSSYQTWTQQAAKQEEQYMAGPLCCLSVTCQNTK